MSILQNNQELSDLSNCVRFLSIDAVQKAKSGHPGMPMGMADIATILFKNHLNFNRLQLLPYFHYLRLSLQLFL